MILSDRQIVLIGKALSDPRRSGILEEVARAGTLPCQSMTAVHEVSPATVSHHVKDLEVAGLIEIRREGKFAFLTFRAEVMRGYVRYLSERFGV